MKNWYCILQGRKVYNMSSEWGNTGSWEQIYKTFVKAETKAEAIQAFHNTVDVKEKIPQRILNKNITPESLLLHVYEVQPGHFTEKFLEDRLCAICGKSYHLIDKFNEFGAYSTYECCSKECDDIYYNNRLERLSTTNENFYSSAPVIYKIENIVTKKVYIGQTIRSFTLRWWEHLKCSSVDKFHTEIMNSSITDWIFSVIEVLNLKEHTKDLKEYLTERERYWICYYDSKNKGYNSI